MTTTSKPERDARTSSGNGAGPSKRRWLRLTIVSLVLFFCLSSIFRSAGVLAVRTTGQEEGPGHSNGLSILESSNTTAARNQSLSFPSISAVSSSTSSPTLQQASTTKRPTALPTTLPTLEQVTAAIPQASSHRPPSPSPTNSIQVNSNSSTIPLIIDPSTDNRKSADSQTTSSPGTPVTFANTTENKDAINDYTDSTYLPAIYKNSIFPNPNWFRRPNTTKYPLPVIVVGLPKAGTSTLKHFFLQAGFKTSHYKCQHRTKRKFCGSCFKYAIEHKQPPLATCGDFEAYTELNYVGRKSAQECFFPQITHLQEIHEEAPNATLILNLRNLTRWVRSVQKWHGLPERLMQCSCGPNSTLTDDLLKWHQDQIDRVHDFVATHPSHKLLVIDIEDPAAGEILADKFNTNSSYWGHANQNIKTEE